MASEAKYVQCGECFGTGNIVSGGENFGGGCGRCGGEGGYHISVEQSTTIPAPQPMTEPLTLAQRLRGKRVHHAFPDIDEDCLEAAVSLDTKDATIASLRDANKALTAELEVTRGDAAYLSRQLVEAEAKLAKVEADAEYDRSLIQKLQAALFYWMPGVSEEIEVKLNGRAGDDAYLLSGFEGDISGECWGNTIIADRESLSAELAEARAACEAALLACSLRAASMGDVVYPDDYDGPLAEGCEAVARSFLSSKEASHAE